MKKLVLLAAIASFSGVGLAQACELHAEHKTPSTTAQNMTPVPDTKPVTVATTTEETGSQTQQDTATE